MPKIYLVRHGKASAGWGDDHDPGLDDLGHSQAGATANILAPSGPLDIISSPLARALETSMHLAKFWNTTPLIEKRVGEIPSLQTDLSDRYNWLLNLMRKVWSNLDQYLQSWRQNVINALCELNADTVVFTHFIAINAAVGEATGDNRVVCFHPDNGSITTFEVNRTSLTLIEYGVEADTPIR